MFKMYLDTNSAGSCYNISSNSELNYYLCVEFEYPKTLYPPSLSLTSLFCHIYYTFECY